MIRAVLVFALFMGAAGADARSAREVLAFKRANPCPSTGLSRGACPGYQVDHTIALCAGGPDNTANMAWLSVEDHRFKTFTDVRECRKLRKMANTPALQKE